MKKIFSLILIVSVALFATNTATAQKFGHIDSQTIINNLPDTKAAQTTFENEGKKFDEQLQTMSLEYQNKVQAYQENMQLADAAPEKWSAAIRQDKEAEIMQLQERIQRFQENAQQSLQQKRQELYAPILEKVDNAVKKVAVAGNYIYVFDKNNVLFINTALSTDLTDAVKKELGM